MSTKLETWLERHKEFNNEYPDPGVSQMLAVIEKLKATLVESTEEYSAFCSRCDKNANRAVKALAIEPEKL